MENNALQSLEHAAIDALPSLMIPFEGRVLLAPTVTVAEMVTYRRPEPIEQAPDWLLGYFQWRDQQVPLLSFERLCGEELADTRPKSRIAVFNSTGASDDLPFIAVPTTGIPTLSRVTPDSIAELDDIEPKPFETMHVVVNGEVAVIPDVAALEAVYIDWLSNQ